MKINDLSRRFGEESLRRMYETYCDDERVNAELFVEAWEKFKQSPTDESREDMEVQKYGLVVQTLQRQGLAIVIGRAGFSAVPSEDD